MNEQEIFAEALELDRDLRAAYLGTACGSDLKLRNRIENLLQVHERAGAYFEKPAAEIVATALVPSPAELPGTTIGPYKLLEQIGEGGFGIVYMAEQSAPVRRKVALKILKPGMDTRQVVARFEAERQALALMDHPNIARVFDGGTTDSGRPYFVMELVKGIPITDYCDQNQLIPRERLELFIPVCLAVQHAHQKGIIHRDIKPSNVLVTLHDDKPVVKVIDFGIAKATSEQLTDKTLYTGFVQMMGTPLYMSPEQAALSAIDVDTRSDIYSLGVLLYELLTGTTPFEKSRLQEVPYDEIRRIIQDEEPPRPSARLSTLRNAETAQTTSQRHRAAHAPGPMFLGELDWIVMKALEKDRNRRYESAGALALDIERHLRDEPVQACPPSNWYRFHKFARRNKSVLATASVVGLAVLLALAALTASTIVISHQQRLTADALQNEKNALQNETRAKGDLAQTLEREREHLAEERRETYFQRITAAHRELSADNLRHALQLLDECPDDLRQWEWRYLMRLCRVAPVVLSDDTAVNGLAFSPDGERIASAGGDGIIKIRNSRTGELQTFRGHTDSVVSVAFHRDGEHLASAGADRLVKVWDLTTEQEVFTKPCDVKRKFGTAHSVVFSPDGRKLAAASKGAVTVWDWKHRQRLYALPPHELVSIPVAFSPDGRLLATGNKTCQQLWDAETGLPDRQIPVHRNLVSALAFSPDGVRLASASFDRTVKMSDVTTGELVQNFDLHTGNVECVAISPDGRLLASGGEDKIVRIWEATTGREVLGLRGHSGRCACVAFSPDGLRIASASTDRTIRIWDATPLQGDEHQEIRTFREHTEEIRSVTFSPTDSQRVASAAFDGSVKVWDVETGRVSANLRRHPNAVWSLAWQPGGERIASAGAHPLSVKVWDSRSGQEAFEIPAEDHSGVPYFAVAFSPDHRYLFTGKGSGAVQFWNARTGQKIDTFTKHDREIWALVFSRDGKHFVSASGDGEVKLWDATHLDKKQPRLTLHASVPGPSVNVALSPDCRRLATGGEKNAVIIWDVESGDKILTLWGEHSGEVYTLAFSPLDDGRLIATAGEDSAVKVWDSHTGKLIHSFRGHTGLVSSLAFSPDGRRLVSGSRDKTVKVWDMTQLQDAPVR